MVKSLPIIDGDIIVVYVDKYSAPTVVTKKCLGRLSVVAVITLASDHLLTSESILLIVSFVGNLRVCTYCCKVVLSYLQDNELSMDLKALQEDLLSKFGDSSEDISSDVSTSSRSRTPTELSRRKISVVYQEEKFATGW